MSIFDSETIGLSWFDVQNKNDISNKIKSLLSLADKYPVNNTKPKAIIVPHASYYYSGLCASIAYNSLKKFAYDINRIIILGTLHNDYQGLFVPEENYIYDINIDYETINKLKIFKYNNSPFLPEHSIRIQIPFIQYIFSFDIKIIPILVGNLDNFGNFADQLKTIDDEKTLWVISTDFSHVNGHFHHKIDTNGIYHNIFKHDRSLIQTLLENKKPKFDNTMSVCGINAIKLWSSMNLEVIGRLGCYYTSINNWNNLLENIKNISPDVNIVSYASIIYTKKNTSQNLENLFSRFEELLLLRFVRQIVQYTLLDEINELILPFKSPNMNLKLGVFVTIKKNDDLRGCIGIITTEDILYNNIPKYALQTAFNDPRFNPVKKDELSQLKYSITILSRDKIELKNLDLNKWRLGSDAIILENPKGHAIFLPQVPIEFNWNKKTTLEHLSLKASNNKYLYLEKDTKLFILPGYEFFE
jgi:uncharacterized protein, PH0010 family